MIDDGIDVEVSFTQGCINLILDIFLRGIIFLLAPPPAIAVDLKEDHSYSNKRAHTRRRSSNIIPVHLSLICFFLILNMSLIGHYSKHNDFYIN